MSAMYTRDFSEEKARIRLPESYAGTAFAEPKATPEPPPAPTRVEVHLTEPPPKKEIKIPAGENPWEATETAAPVKEKVSLSALFGKAGKFFADAKEKLPISLHGAGDDAKIHLPTPDTEDLLILLVALFLFFQKSGDKIGALLVLSLLFFPKDENK